MFQSLAVRVAAVSHFLSFLFWKRDFFVMEGTNVLVTIKHGTVSLADRHCQQNLLVMVGEVAFFETTHQFVARIGWIVVR